jgi:thioredoxin-dependent peroxiredoxin
MSLAVGDVAPDFSLPGTSHEAADSALYSLSDFGGQRVVLVFYPADNSPVCTSQLNAYTRDIEDFDHLRAQVLAISPQDVATHLAFSAKHGGFKFPLLSDVDKSVGQKYGVVGPLGFYRRSVVVVDSVGQVAYVQRSITGLTYKSSDELVKAVEAAS